MQVKYKSWRKLPVSYFANKLHGSIIVENHLLVAASRSTACPKHLLSDALCSRGAFELARFDCLFD